MCFRVLILTCLVGSFAVAEPYEPDIPDRKFPVCVPLDEATPSITRIHHVSRKEDCLPEIGVPGEDSDDSCVSGTTGLCVRMNFESTHTIWGTWTLQPKIFRLDPGAVARAIAANPRLFRAGGGIQVDVPASMKKLMDASVAAFAAQQ